MELLQIKKRLIKHSDLILLSLIVAAMPFKLNYTNLFLIAAFLYSLYKLIIKKEKVKLMTFFMLFPLLFFLITLVSALVSEDVPTGLKAVDRNLLLLLIPITLAVLTREEVPLKKLFLVFISSNVVATAFLLIVNVLKYAKGLDTSQLFFHEFTQPYRHHPVYYSLNLAMSCFMLNDLSFKGLINFKYGRSIFYIFTSILIAGIFFCSSKIIITLFSILYVVQLLLKIKKSKHKILIVFLSTVALVSISNIDYVKNRFKEGLKIEFSEFQPVDDIRLAKRFTYSERKSISDLDHRMLLAKIGFFHLINDEKLLTGYGVGDVQNYLDYYYMTYGLAPNWFEGHNLHNQYLEILISHGLPVFLFFMIYLVTSSYQLIRSKNIIYIYFVLIMVTAFCFESYLMRNKGIVFLYFFITIFLIDLQKKARSHD